MMRCLDNILEVLFFNLVKEKNICIVYPCAIRIIMVWKIVIYSHVIHFITYKLSFFSQTMWFVPKMVEIQSYQDWILVRKIEKDKI